MMVDMRGYARVLLDAAVIIHAPPDEFRRFMESCHANSVQMYTSGSYDAQISQNLIADKEKKLKNFRENYRTVTEYIEEKQMPLEIETLRSSFSDIRTAAREMSRICERNGQRMLLVTADRILCMSIVLMGIKADMLYFSADLGKAKSVELIPIEAFENKCREISYPWERNLPHRLHEKMPVAKRDGKKPLILKVKGSDKPIVLKRCENQPGGEADLYISEAYPDLIAKIYHKPPVRAKLNNIQELMDIGRNNDIRFTILPLAKLVNDEGHEVGYLMKYVKEFKPLSDEQVFRFKDDKNLDAHVLDAIHFCLWIVWQIREQACLGILVYDFNDNNFGIDQSTNKPVLLDSDSFPNGEYLPQTCANGFYQPSLEHDSATRSEAISVCLKSVYLFVAYTLLGRPPVDAGMKFNESAWERFSYRIPEKLRSFLKKVVQMNPEEVPYLDALIDQLNAVEKTLPKDCTYSQLRNADPEPPRPVRKAHRFEPWESVLRTPKDSANEPKFLVDQEWFNLFPEVRSGAEIFGWKRAKKPAKPARYRVVSVVPRQQHPPKVSDASKKRELRKKHRNKRLCIALVLLVLAFLLTADQKYIEQIPVVIGKIREALAFAYERTIGALWEHPLNPIPGWIESLKSILFPR